MACPFSSLQLASELPSWFVDDEERHSQPQKPVTKEEVAEYKMMLKGIDARNTKKVAEAAARKKKKVRSVIKFDTYRVGPHKDGKGKDQGEDDCKQF